jgi:hypothetical protein
MNTITNFQCYRLFHRLRAHFTVDTFDYFAPEQLPITLNGFRSKPAHVRNRFTELATQLKTHEDAEGFFLSQLVDARRDVWFGDFSGPESDFVYQQWKARRQSLHYRLMHEFRRLVDRNGLGNLFQSEPGQHPIVLVERLKWRAGTNDSISPETFVLMNAVLDFFPLLDGNLFEDFAWIRMRSLAEKYRPFVVPLAKTEQLEQYIKERSTQ